MPLSLDPTQIASFHSSSLSVLPSGPPTIPAPNNTMGAWLIGTYFGILLQGLGYHQTYRYFRLYPRDPTYLKTWVVLLLIVETVTTALFMHTCYYYLVTNYFNPTILLMGPVWSLKLFPIPACLSAVITQTFFARRIFLISPRFRPIAVIAELLIFTFLGCVIVLTALGWNKPTMAGFLELSWLASAASAIIMAADVIMTIMLIYFLRRNHTGVTRTDSVLDLLILYAVSSGLVTCIFNVLNVTFSLLWPDNLVFGAISIILAKLYANTFLVSLNARKSLIIERGGIMNDTTPFRSTILRPTRHNGTMMDVEDTHELDAPTKRAESKDIELKVVTVLVETDTHSQCDEGLQDKNAVTV